MSFRVEADECIGCGSCDYSCPTGALEKTDSFLGIFSIDPYLCDDCGKCVTKCPEDCIVVDPDWPICHGHGCPLTAKRLSNFECAIWQQTCSNCGSTMWQAKGTETWVCSRCDLTMRVLCPKTHHLSVPVTQAAPVTQEARP